MMDPEGFVRLFEAIGVTLLIGFVMITPVVLGCEVADKLTERRRARS